MDDSCAVCADSLEWVAYGPCGHRDVCSTCVARLRFICDDRRCCICKSDCSIVFVTKALGNYTRTLNDFSKLPSHPKEGQVGSYWYHEDTQAFFDDVEPYKIIKAMCRLSCSVCDKAAAEEQQQDGFRRRQRFRNIGQLKGHLSHQHRLFMCDLCLEGRKVFICEQKLYTRAQLNQHKRAGDSEVDGTESERGGFAGHPMCEFCRSSFYGENELYSHMSTEHFTCHICQRQHPGQYEYYRDYDDLETHFRQGHYLCEDEACLAKKFIVFQTEADLKRHNALEHGGRMSRSKRNAVLQIPTSFRYRSSNESGHHRGRRQSFRRESSPDNELNMAIQASLESVNAGNALPEPSPSPSPSPVAAPLGCDGADSSDVDSLVQPFESLSSTDSEPSSRYRQAVSQSSTNVRLGESSFPPLSTAGSSSQQKSQQESQDTMAARLRRQNNANVLNVAQPRPAKNRMPTPATSAPWPVPGAVVSSGPVQSEPEAVNGHGSSSYASSLHSRPVTEPGLAIGGSWASRNQGGSSKSPNLMDSRAFDPVSDFPPVSAAQPNRSHSSGQSMKTEDVQTANKSLVERIRTALDHDENKYSAFKEISQEYRQGLIDTWEYLEYVKQFDLTHLVPDLARLCPDVRKQKELVEAYNATSQSDRSEENFWANGSIHVKGRNSSRKDKGKKMVDAENSLSKEALADSIISTVKNLQSQLKPPEGEVEVLEKAGYRASRGKSTVTVTESRSSIQHPVTQPTGSTAGLASAGGGSKQKKKTSKFHRIRLGDDSAAAVLDTRNSTSDPSSAETGAASGWPNPSEGLSARGVWRSGDGQRLFGK